MRLKVPALRRSLQLLSQLLVAGGAEEPKDVTRVADSRVDSHCIRIFKKFEEIISIWDLKD